MLYNNGSGREHHLIATALAVALATIDRAEPHLRPLSDRDDMAALLESMIPSGFVRSLYISSAKGLLGAKAKVRVTKMGLVGGGQA